MEQTRDREFRTRPMNRLDESDRDQTDLLLRNLGADDILIETVVERVDDDEVQSVVTRLRTFAEENPRIVLGALSALIAGGAVVAGRAVAKKSTARKSRAAASTRSAKPRAKTSKRTLIEPHAGDKRYIRRDAKGRIKESVDVGRSLSADSRRHSKKKTKSGSGDKGDR